MFNEPALTRLQVARLAAGVQQQQLAREAGISPGRLSAFERGHDDLTGEQRERLSELLGYSQSALFPPDGHVLEPAVVRRWLLSDNDEGPAGRPDLVDAPPRSGRHVKQ